MASRLIAGALAPWIFCLAFFAPKAALPADWPMWRCDAVRSGVTPATLPDQLHLQWVLARPEPQPAWPSEQAKLQFDASYDPVVVGTRLFVPSMVHDNVTCYDTRTGQKLWTYFADGPVRFAPVATAERLYFVSDDGYLYCLRSDTGSLLWKFRGGPNERRILGNDRMISCWPARGAPVLADNTIYFTAGIWPFMGIFVHAVDATTGQPIWLNSGSGSEYLTQPHGSPAFAGVAPQGYLAVRGDLLLVAGGRTVPAGFERASGRMRFYVPGGNKFGKDAGGYDILSGPDWFHARGGIYQTKDGLPITRLTPAVLTDDQCVQLERGKLEGYSPRTEIVEKVSKDVLGKEKIERETRFPKLWDSAAPPGVRQIHFQAGKQLVVSDGQSLISLLDLPNQDREHAEIAWQTTVRGRVWQMLAADDRLFAITREGWIYCFGREPKEGVKLPELPVAVAGETVIEYGSPWRTLANGTSPNGEWRIAGFDDSAWRTGTTDLAGSDEDKSVVDKLADVLPKGPVTTSYFRRHFDLPAADKWGRLRLRVRAEDGFAVHLNGKEVHRYGLPEGKLDSRTQALATAPLRRRHELFFDLKDCQPGSNLLAIEAHRTAKGTGAVSFNIELAHLEPEEAPLPAGGPRGAAKPPPGETDTIRDLLGGVSHRDGWCLWLGAESIDGIIDLARSTEMQVVVLDRDAAQVQALRERLAAEASPLAVHAIQGDLGSIPLPQYFASLVVCPAGEDWTDANAAGFLRRLFPSIRPYGGVAALRGSDKLAESVRSGAKELELEGVELARNGSWYLVRRPGPIKGSAPWTHDHGDSANTLISQDALVRAPLGLLWYGGPSHQGILPRHGHGPTPAVVGGRLIIEGPDMLRAVDVYTGRLLWESELQGIGQYYDNTRHQPGAAAIGSNYVAADDAIYVAYGREGLKLDPATGVIKQRFDLPADASGDKPIWGYLIVSGDVLLVASSPLAPVSSTQFQHKEGSFADYAEGSKRIVALNRHTGAVLWKRDAEFQFRHNAIIAAEGRVFCLDRYSETQLAWWKRRGEEPTGTPAFIAVDLQTGRDLWKIDDHVFGTWLSYSREHKVVLQAGSVNRDRAKDESTQGMAVFRAEDGSLVWNDDLVYSGPCLLVGDRILTQNAAFHLMTGKPFKRNDPLTGESVEWKFSRNYGCNSAIGCTNLLAFRSAAAGYFDLAGDGGTGNLGGFRSSCTSNLVPADGVLSAPDYTRTCVCSYQNQCSLAFVHMPEVETWTFNTHSRGSEPVKRLGLNFGAPGDRRVADASLWIEIPSVGGTSPKVPVEITGQKVEYFRQHSSRLESGPLPWVAASGVRGAEHIKITLEDPKDPSPPRKYTVRLYFADLVPEKPKHPENAGPARMDVSLQDRVVLTRFDIRAAAGGVNRGVVREFAGIEAAAFLEITLAPTDDGDSTSLSGVEIVEE